MNGEQIDTRGMVIRVAREEYERFLKEDTFLPQCAQFAPNHLPDCCESCPENLTCVAFTYDDEEYGLVYEWFACTSQEQLTRLWPRAVPETAGWAKKRIKYIAYRPATEDELR